MATGKFKGVIVPILTPLTSDERVDTVSLRRLVDYLIDSGVHGVWAAGTTGEFAALTDQQRLLAIETVVDAVGGRVPVIGNISASSTQLAVDLALSVQEFGLDGIAATPPYYYPCAQDEILSHYRYISARVGSPVWVYNIPSTVKTAVEPVTIAQLAGEGVVTGVKDSSGAGELFAELTLLCEEGGIEISRFIGSMYRVTMARSVGAHGVIPSLANLAAASFVGAWEAGERGDRESALKHHARIMSATRVQRLARGSGRISANLAGMKSALMAMGIIDDDNMTRPMRRLTDEEKQAIPGILNELGLSVRR